ncbi:MAG: phosphatase PAP2 family protein [Alphaproteobacteria bacterium]|nr:phosphatase PAP2 family protein [Alphaproteobacteria bacterium]
MFLTPNNQLKKKWLVWGGVIVAILVVLGFAGLDRFLYPIINNPECNPWFIDGDFGCRFAFVVGKVFQAKVWLILTGILSLVVLIKKIIKSGIKYRNAKKHFSFVVVAKDCLSKIRTNYAFLVFSSVFFASITTGILKVLIGRPRPILFTEGFHPFLFEWAFNSMPSGHATATFAGLVMLGMLVPKWKPLTWSIAIVVGVSRIYIGAHWPTDVIVGAFIGMVAADLVKHWAFTRK